MLTKEQLIQEIEQSPDYLMEEVLNFLLFIKMRLYQKEEPLKSFDNSILNMVDEITAQIPPEELNQLPSDLSKNLDYYLYDYPKIEE